MPLSTVKCSNYALLEIDYFAVHCKIRNFVDAIYNEI